MGSISVDIQVEDIWYELEDRHLVEEMKRRKLELPDEAKDAIRTAIAQIRRGDTLDAITTLEREFWPKWASVEDSEWALRMATYVRPAKPANDTKEAAPAASATGGVE